MNRWRYNREAAERRRSKARLRKIEAYQVALTEREQKQEIAQKLGFRNLVDARAAWNRAQSADEHRRPGIQRTKPTRLKGGTKTEGR